MSKIRKILKITKKSNFSKIENFDFRPKKNDPKKIRPHFFVNEKIEKSKKKKTKNIVGRRELGDELQTANLWKRQLKLPSALRGRF